ncbi:unnamed protein product [Oppiella nova]|uniref:Transcription initiation factor IIA subunit 2 n=1 Tax=Oppiella nova TaxID=334625 RepID=A0A7R9LLZ6_9ACAR|nr:unnamed protein product [Oppiella nova]CAG2164920.1 unnamed protein product [Oppiella nova]
MNTRLCYRTTTVGNALWESLAEMHQSGQLSERLANKCLHAFDASVDKAFDSYTKGGRQQPDLSFVTPQEEKDKGNGAKLAAYRFADNVWNLIVRNVEFKEGNKSVLKVDKLKIVAMNGNTGAQIQYVNKGSKKTRIV